MNTLSALLAQSSAPARDVSADTEPIRAINTRLRDQLDVLNHPDQLAEIVTQMNFVWAVIFITVGAICVLNGYRWHKGIIVVLAAMSGVWAGTVLGRHVGDVTIAAACLAVLFAIVAWPLLRYSVALFGGLVGAFAGANVWTAIGGNPEHHQMGAIIGLVAVGLLAFLAFRAVVIVLTTVGGASLLTFGALAALLYVQGWHDAIIDGMRSKPLIVPIIVASAAGVGAVIQLGGGVKGLNAMADKADPVKARKQQKAAA